MIILFYLPVLILLSLLYFKLAIRFQILDRPNKRSSHTHVTIRGGGVIFPLAFFLEFLISGFDLPFFSIGLLLISCISLYDDLRPLSNKIRLLAHLSAVSLLFTQLDLMSQDFWVIVIAFIIVIGTINAYNFMDGINGLTGAYSLVMAGSLYFINLRVVEFIPSQWLIVCVLSLFVFNLFNFRRNAKCFAGDVGSISMAFILIYFVTILIIETGDIKFSALFLMYGLDSVTTILFRLLRRENIFKAHRFHFYQYLTNTKLWPHIAVSTLYAFLQLFVNMILIYSTINFFQFLILILTSGLVAVVIRLIIEGKDHLFGLNSLSKS